jgi:hypothetical protein
MRFRRCSGTRRLCSVHRIGDSDSRGDRGSLNGETPNAKFEILRGCRAKSCRESEGVPQITISCGKPAPPQCRHQAKPPTGCMPARAVGAAPLRLSPSPGDEDTPWPRALRPQLPGVPLSQKGDLPLRMETKGRHGGLPLPQSAPDSGDHQDRPYIWEGIEGASWCGLMQGACRGAKPLCVSHHPPLPKGDSGGLALGDEVEVGTARASAAFCGHDGTWPYVGRSGFLLSQE